MNKLDQLVKSTIAAHGLSLVRGASFFDNIYSDELKFTIRNLLTLEDPVIVVEVTHVPEQGTQTYLGAVEDRELKKFIANELKLLQETLTQRHLSTQQNKVNSVIEQLTNKLP